MNYHRSVKINHGGLSYANIEKFFSTTVKKFVNQILQRAVSEYSCIFLRELHGIY